MPFDPNKPFTQVSGFDPSKPFKKVDEMSLSGGIKNLGTDIANTARGTYDLGKTVAEMGLGINPKESLKKSTAIAKGIVPGVINEGKRVGVGKLLEGEPVAAAKQFGRALYDKPLTTTMDVAGVASLPKTIAGVGRALGAEPAAASIAEEAASVAPKAGMVDDVARVAPEAPGAINMGDEAAKILKEPVKPKAEQIFDEAPKQKATGGSPISELQDFVSKKYGRAAKTPGAIENFGKALEQKARGMTLKEIGGTPGMGRTLKDRFGEKAISDLADLAEDKGITKGFFNFQTGDEIKNLMQKSGDTIGTARKMATERGAVHDPGSLIGKIRAELDPVYMKGTGSSQKNAYLKALQDIKDSPMDAESLAETISQKNKFIKKNKMTQPLGAATDVLNAANRANNELIGKFLKPGEVDMYKESLRDFSASKVFDKMYGHTYGRDMFGRSGPASPLNMIKDVGGRKILQKVFSRVGKGMQRNPEAFKNPLNLSEDVLDSISEALDEVIDQMGSGEKQ